MAASAGGKAALALWVDIDPADDSFFEHWHSREHVQERVGCPGWLRGSRFKGVETPERYMSRAIFPKFRDTWRTVCTVEQRWGDGIGAAVLTLRMKAGNTAPFDKLAALETVRVDLLAGQANLGQAHTAEKDLRPTPDRQIELALVAFFWSIEAAQAARVRHAPQGEVFVLRHTVSKGDLPG